MKNSLKTISNKLKAVYILWAFINFFLLVIGFGSNYNYSIKLRYFYPFVSEYWSEPVFFLYVGFNENIFDWFIRVFVISAFKFYDFSEFLIYVLFPFIIYYSYHLFRKLKID